MTWTAYPQTLRADVPIRDHGPSAVRITRRGRVLLVLALVSLLLAAFSFGRTATQAATEAGPRQVLPSVTVSSGDTLWILARRIAPGHDPREVIAQIQRLNHLDGPSVQVGQQLLLPRSA